jgi:hypothetical protein
MQKEVSISSIESRIVKEHHFEDKDKVLSDKNMFEK